jgi:small ligand-binding sensory domain FIST
MAARSFCISITTPDGLGRPLAATRAEVSSPSGGLVFVSGAMTQEIDRIAEQVRAAWRNVPVCIVPGAGVITERGEIEGASAACGILWSGGRASPFALGDTASPQALREALGGPHSPHPPGAPGFRSMLEALPPEDPQKAPEAFVQTLFRKGAATVLLFPRSDFASEMLEGIAATAPGICIFGAGTVGGSAVALTAAGEILRGRAAGMAIHGLSAPLVESSAACRLVTPLRTVDETSAGLVLRVDGTPALDLLSSCMPEIRGAAPGGSPTQPQPVVFVALAEPGDSERYVVRPVRGIDPSRRGVMVGPEVKPGVRLAFAVRDAASARAGLEVVARTLSQQALGSAPRFALYLSCAGRGQGLYGAPDVEARILRQRFGDLPIAGMHAAFEIVPWAPGEARVALYTGVLALFRSPS